MDLTFSELKCPKCGGELHSGNTQVSQDVQMVKRCSNRYEQSKLCDFWMIIVIPHKDYDYSVSRKLKSETVGG